MANESVPCTMIRLPHSSSAQPARLLSEFINCWRDYSQNGEYQKALKDSIENPDEQKEWKRAACEARRRLRQEDRLQRQICQSKVYDDNFMPGEKALLDDVASGALRRATN